MRKVKETATETSDLVCHDDLLRIIGDVDESKILEIVALHPTLVEVEEAAAWAGGDGDILDRSGHSLMGTAAQIYDILTADEEDNRSPP